MDILYQLNLTLFIKVDLSAIGTFLRTDHEEAQESSVFACVKRCVSASDCKSINYKTQGSGNNCFLNKKSRKEAGETAIEANQDFVYYNIDYHTQRSEEPEFGTSNINMVSRTTRKRICFQSFIYLFFWENIVKRSLCRYLRFPLH